MSTGPAALAPWLLRQWQALRAHRGHALLLSGPAGLGQYELALALARGWLCERPGESGPCGTCGSCHAVDVRTHADLCTLMPETLALELGWPLDEKTQDRIDKKEIKPSRWIRVEAARSVIAFSQLTRSRGSTKVVLVWPADRLNTESANTLLKTLEEPPGALRFVLATEAAHALPPTVRSRCQHHAMAWPRDDEALSWLGERMSDDKVGTAADAAVWWRAAGQRPDAALELARSGLPARLWPSLPRALAQGDWSALKEWSPGAQLQLLQKLCHDLMARAAGAPPRFFQTDDLPPAPSMAVLSKWQRRLQQSLRTLEHPYNPGLMQEAWAAEAQAVLAIN